MRKLFMAILLLTGVLFFNPNNSHAIDISLSDNFQYDGATYKSGLAYSGFDLNSNQNYAIYYYCTNSSNWMYVLHQSWSGNIVVGYCGDALIIDIRDGRETVYTKIPNFNEFAFSYTNAALINSMDILDYFPPYPVFQTRTMSYSPPAIYQLAINVNPSAGGTVTGMPGVLSCTNGTCTGTFGGNETLTASASNSYAFGFWDNGTTITDNPYSFNLNSNASLTAKFFKTFRNAVDNFYSNVGDTGGECVTYVKTETGITKADGSAFDGDAWEYYQEAVTAGYQTSDIPRQGSIAVFDKSTLPDYGHVGIVVDKYIKPEDGHLHLILRHSNWCSPATCHTVSQDDVDVDGKVIHYIYFTP